MRPSLLDPLFASLSSLPGIGAKTGELYARLLGRESLDDARARHAAARAELPLAAQQMSRGEPVIPTLHL